MQRLWELAISAIGSRNSLRIFFSDLLHRAISYLNMRARREVWYHSRRPEMVVRTHGCDACVARVDPLGATLETKQAVPAERCWKLQMKKAKAPTDSDPGPRLQSVNQYLEKNFPDFFAEARFQVGDDDYFLYARFGQYLARSIEQNRASREKINRGFTVLNKMARVSARHPRIRQMLVSGPLEYIVDAPKARALALKRLSPVAQGYMESLCE